MKKYLTLLAGAMFLTACSNDAEDIAGNNGYQPSTDAIAFEFNGDEVENATRASGAIYNDVALRANKIGVFTSYTGKLKYENVTVSPDFMWNQSLTYTGTAWGYAPLKYWPNALAEVPEYLSFFAYAPYEAAPASDKCITDISDNNVTGDPWVNYRLAKYPWDTTIMVDDDNNPSTPDVPQAVAADQVDLLFGTRKNGTTYEPWTDVTNWDNEATPTAKLINHKVQFTMKHALASIGNRITIGTNAELNGLIFNYSEIKIYGIKIEYKNLTNKARLILNSADGTANWKEIISGELTTTRTYLNMFASPMTFDGSSSTAVDIPYLNGPATGAPDPSTSTQGDGLFYIPLKIAGTEDATATVTLYYRVHILGPNIYKPLETEPAAEASNTFKLDNNLEGKMQGIALTLGKDYDLMHEVWTLGGTAIEPSYSRFNK